MSGDVNLIVEARTALLDALQALDSHIDSVILVGAQAVYLRTGDTDFGIAAATADSDFVLDPRSLRDEPLIEKVMSDAGFMKDPTGSQPGAWISPLGIPVDLMVPATLAGRGRRSVEIPPHDSKVARSAHGLEASLVDNDRMQVDSLAKDDRTGEIRVAGPSALLVSKAYRIGERRDCAPTRLKDKDAHDMYRLLVACSTEGLVSRFGRLLADPLSAEVSSRGLDYIDSLFGTPESLGSIMAGRAERFVGDPDLVASSASMLVQQLIRSMGTAAL